MDLEHQRCYIYQPSETEERATKRQRVDNAHFQPQLRERLQIYRDLWAEQEERIQSTLEEADSATQGQIVDFVSGSGASPDKPKFAIPAGLVVAGPSIASHGPYFERLGRRIRSETDSAYILLTSGESPNLKTLLKNLIKKATSRVEDDDDDDLDQPSRPSRHGPKLLNYDLGHIQEWRKKNPVSSVVVTIQDSEAFDAGLLADLVDLIHSWLDRIPFALLFGIATSADSFEDRLSGQSLRYLDGERFDVTQSDDIIEKLFSATVASRNNRLFVGPNLCSRMLDRQKDYVQNVQDFCDGLKYAYMSHCYASVPAVLLRASSKNDLDNFDDFEAEAFEAVRNLPSFRQALEAGLADGDRKATQMARDMLEFDEVLYKHASVQIARGQEKLVDLSIAANVVFCIRESLQLTPSMRSSTVWIRAASADLLESPMLRETMLSLKKATSDRMVRLLEDLEAIEDKRHLSFISSSLDKLNKLLESHAASTPLRTEHDVRNDSVRTTVIAQKVLLSKHKAALSDQDRAYSSLVSDVHQRLEDFFERVLIDPQDLMYNEILMYDLKSPHLEVFQPKPRLAIERAMASPHDYLSCDCCGAVGGKDSALGATQPATAIVYQMYLESGALINVTDLWSAFKAIAGDEDDDDETKTMALFQRALAELRYLGLLRPTKKKTDHVAKVMWKGL